MATKIILKKSSVAAAIPAAGTLEPGELAINLADRVLYSKDTGGTVFSISGSGGTSYTNADVDTHLNTSTAASGEVLSWNGTDYDWIATGGTGTVTSVSATVPAGFTISGSPITGSGTLVFDYATGYQGYTTAEATKLSGIEAGADVTDAANVEPLVDTHLNTSTAATGEVLSWNGTDYDWVAAGTGGTSYTDSDVDTHLNTSTAATNEVLAWNGTDYVWVAGVASSYTDTSVDTHLNTSTAATGEVLTWNGSDYVWSTATRRTIDGGFASSVYTTTQSVDGGSSSTVYASGQVINGGSA